MLTLGVPGSGTTAVMVGALSLYNITPGPALFTQNPTLVWGLIASLFIANVMLLFINIPMVGVFTKVLRLPNWALVPGILAVSAVGVYSVHATTFDLLLMSGLGVAGYLLRKQGMPMAPLILGFVLGDLMEQNLRRALSITNGELGILVESPISIGLWIGAAAMVVVPPLMRLRARRKSRCRAQPEPGDTHHATDRTAARRASAQARRLPDRRGARPRRLGRRDPGSAQAPRPGLRQAAVQGRRRQEGQVGPDRPRHRPARRAGREGAPLLRRAPPRQRHRQGQRRDLRGRRAGRARGLLLDHRRHPLSRAGDDDHAPRRRRHRGARQVRDRHRALRRADRPEGLRRRQRARPTSARRARSSRRWCSSCPSCGSCCTTTA